MQSHYDLDDNTFEHLFDTATLNPTLFTHEAHLRLAWIHIQKYGLEDAITHICEQIAHFDAMLGNGTKYHETITIAAIKMVNHFMLKTPSPSFKTFIEHNPRLLHNFKDLLHSHYSSYLLTNEVARLTFLEPDLLPF